MAKCKIEAIIYHLRLGCAHRSMSSCMESSPVISCQKGQVIGTVSRPLAEGSKAVYRYRNLPFGKSTAEERRFMPPEPVVHWNGILDCTKPTYIPMQNVASSKAMQYFTPTKTKLRGSDIVVTEDCLRLAVYTPEDFQEKRYPVMVWFYGGAFQMGFAEVFDGTALSGMFDVVVVVPNYRVGVFGFFSLGPDSPCTGNAGLFDQRLALQWVQDNISSFGGDKYNVTIFGESAGGCSVNHHINSRMSRGLFHKAISHSGQGTLAKIFKRDLSRARKTFLEHLRIAETDPTRILDVLQKMSAADLMEADQFITTQFMAFDPTLDKKFLTKTPTESLHDGDFNKVPYIIGCNDSEGHGMLTLLARVPNYVEGMSEEDAKLAILNFVPRMSQRAKRQCQQACIDYYTNHRQDPMRYSKTYGDVYTDSMFIAPAVNTADIHAASGCPVFVYFGTFQLKFNHDKEYGPKVGQKPPWCGCDHSDDICMMWGVPFCPGVLSGGAKFSKEETELSRQCMAYITNFARHGDPNIGKPVDVQWPLYTRGKQYLNLGLKPKVDSDLAPEKVKFWKQTIYDIAEKYSSSDAKL